MSVETVPLEAVPLEAVPLEAVSVEAAWAGLLPDRVWISGPCGSGKSTLAAEIAQARGMTATHMDDLHWNPGWIDTPDDELRRKVEVVTGGPRWVLDGNYTRVRRTQLHRVQLNVWLDLPLPLTFSRVFRRMLQRSFKKVPCCNGNFESVWRSFTRKDSILLWSLTHHSTTRRNNEDVLAGLPTLRLRTPQQVAAWRKRVLAATRGTPGASRRASLARQPSAPAG